MEKKTGIGDWETMRLGDWGLLSSCRACSARISKASFAYTTIVLLFLGCSGNNGSQKIIESENKKSIKRFTLIETEGNQKKWVMDAEEATDAGEVLHIKNFKIKFYEDDKVQALLKAESGSYNKETKGLKTFGNIEFEAEGKKIITKNVTWNPIDKLFVTEEEVLITTEDGVLKGIGMEASMDFQDIKIKHKISGELKMEDGR